MVCHVPRLTRGDACLAWPGAQVRRRFARFLRTFQNDDGDYVYRQRVREMARSEWPLLPSSFGAAAGGLCSTGPLGRERMHGGLTLCQRWPFT